MAYEQVMLNDHVEQLFLFSFHNPLFKPEGSPVSPDTTHLPLGSISVYNSVIQETPPDHQNQAVATQLQLFHQEGSFFMKPPRSSR